jgi:biopolymer transport protein ExbD
MKMTAATAAGVNLGLIITPMLDMSFQILAFFIMTYHPSALEGHVSGTLAGPHVAGGEHDFTKPLDIGLEDLSDTIVVRVKTSGVMPGQPEKLYIKRTVVPVPQQIADEHDGWPAAKRRLSAELTRIQKEGGAERSSVKIEADGDLRQEFVMQVYDICKQAGFSKIHFVAPPHGRVASR